MPAKKRQTLNSKQPGKRRRGGPRVVEPLADAEARAIRRERVAEMLAYHRTYREIAAELGCCIATVHDDREAILAEYRERYREAGERMVEQETAALDRMEREALDEWRRSRDVRALEAALKCKSRKHAMWGFDKPTKIAPVTPDGDEPYAVIPDDALERQLRKLLGDGGEA